MARIVDNLPDNSSICSLRVNHEDAYDRFVYRSQGNITIRFFVIVMLKGILSHNAWLQPAFWMQ